MLNKKSVNNHGNDKLFFIQEFLKHPLQIGSIIPSSRFLEQRIVQTADVASANVVVELGPGTGGTTRAILRAMPQQARLLTIEINPYFHSMINNITDKRLIAHLGSAYDLPQIISRYKLDAPDAVISGIPFSTMNRSAGAHIIEAISSILATKGRFVAYQASERVATLCEPVLGTAQFSMEFLNIPPMRIYSWEKTNS